VVGGSPPQLIRRRGAPRCPWEGLGRSRERSGHRQCRSPPPNTLHWSCCGLSPTSASVIRPAHSRVPPAADERGRAQSTAPPLPWSGFPSTHVLAPTTVSAIHPAHTSPCGVRPLRCRFASLPRLCAAVSQGSSWSPSSACFSSGPLNLTQMTVLLLLSCALCASFCYTPGDKLLGNFLQRVGSQYIHGLNTRSSWIINCSCLFDHPLIVSRCNTAIHSWYIIMFVGQPLMRDC
jgi:hypothetical protein